MTEGVGDGKFSGGKSTLMFSIGIISGWWSLLFSLITYGVLPAPTNPAPKAFG